MTLDDWRMLALQELLLLGGGVRVTLIVTGAGDARGRAPVVLVNVFWIATKLFINAPPVRALALSLTLSLAF